MSKAQRAELNRIEADEETLVADMFECLGEPEGFDLDNQGIRVHQVFAY